MSFGPGLCCPLTLTRSFEPSQNLLDLIQRDDVFASGLYFCFYSLRTSSWYREMSVGQLFHRLTLFRHHFPSTDASAPAGLGSRWYSSCSGLPLLPAFTLAAVPSSDSCCNSARQFSLRLLILRVLGSCSLSFADVLSELLLLRLELADFVLELLLLALHFRHQLALRFGIPAAFRRRAAEPSLAIPRLFSCSFCSSCSSFTAAVFFSRRSDSSSCRLQRSFFFEPSALLLLLTSSFLLFLCCCSLARSSLSCSLSFFSCCAAPASFEVPPPRVSFPAAL